LQSAADAATASKNAPRVSEILKAGGGAAVVGWKASLSHSSTFQISLRRVASLKH
jgi:hypothetical protein